MICCTKLVGQNIACMLETEHVPYLMIGTYNL